MYDARRVSIVFPAYNEEENIAQAVCEFLATGVVDEVVVVDNRSKDATAALARTAGARVVEEQRQGYGYALQRGLAEASGDYIVLCEPDGTFVGRDILKLLAYAEDFDMVCGTRTTREVLWDNANMGWFLRVGNIVVAKALEFLYSTPSLSDCGCTYRLIRADAAMTILPELTVGGSHFLPEMVILAVIHDLPFIEIPLTYRGRIGESKITGTLKGTLVTGFNMIGLIIRHRFRRHRLRSHRPGAVRALPRQPPAAAMTAAPLPEPILTGSPSSSKS